MDGVARFAGQDTSRVTSGTIWGDCPIEAINDGVVSGCFFRDDFMTMPGGAIPTTEGAFGQYAAFSSTGGTIANDTTERGGAWAFGSDGDNEGASIRSLVTPFQIILTGGEFWFEARILTSTITDTKHDIFVGLMESASLSATVPITATGTLADQNLVGFFRPETARSVAGTGGAIMNTVYKANTVTAVTVQSDAVALVAATYTKVGMRFIPQKNIGKGSGYLYFYQDGVQLTGSKLIPSAAGTDFPNDVPLAPVFAVLNATGTTPGTSSIDWWQMAQLI